jgi:hypothetical protein
MLEDYLLPKGDTISNETVNKAISDGKAQLDRLRMTVENLDRVLRAREFQDTRKQHDDSTG